MICTETFLIICEASKIGNQIWQLIKKENDLPKVIYMSTLKRHTGTVNVVRFSPKGDILATAGD
ncbi:11197_t:CDS:2, partial [Entrophospora sp. SA101]